MTVAPDNTLYVTDFSAAAATVWQAGPDFEYINQVLSPVGELPLTGTVHGDPIGVAVTGSTATSDLKVWTADPGFGVPVTAALGDNTFPGAYNDLFRYDIGSGPLPWNHAPNFAVNLGLPGFFDILTLDVTVGYDGKLIGMFYRANFSDGCIQVFFKTNTISDTTFPSYEANVFGNWFGDVNWLRNPTNNTAIAHPVTSAMNDGQWYNWRIEKQNKSLIIYVNNSLQYSYYGPLFSGGYLVFTSRYAGSTAQIDNLRIYELASTLNIRKAVYVDLGSLTVGSNYQFQVSSDLLNWTNQGSPFTATDTYWRSTNYWDVENWNELFFRLKPQ